MGDDEAICKTHGTEYIEFKCRYCCVIAIWFCFGTTHFCEPHHNDGGGKGVHCDGKKETCALGVDHKPNPVEMSLGCSLCKGISKEAKDF